MAAPAHENRLVLQSCGLGIDTRLSVALIQVDSRYDVGLGLLQGSLKVSGLIDLLPTELLNCTYKPDIDSLIK